MVLVEPVRHRYHRHAVKREQRGLDLRSRCRVERGGGLIHEEHLLSVQQGARNRHTLALSARKARAVLPHRGVEALRKRRHNAIETGKPNRPDDVIPPERAPKGDVLAQGAVEEKDALVDGDGLWKRARLAIDEHRTRLRNKRAREDAEQCALSAAAHTRNGILAPGLEAHGAVTEDLPLLSVIGKRHPFEAKGVSRGDAAGAGRAPSALLRLVLDAPEQGKDFLARMDLRKLGRDLGRGRYHVARELRDGYHAADAHKTAQGKEARRSHDAELHKDANPTAYAAHNGRDLREVRFG